MTSASPPTARMAVDFAGLDADGFVGAQAEGVVADARFDFVLEDGVDLGALLVEVGARRARWSACG